MKYFLLLEEIKVDREHRAAINEVAEDPKGWCMMRTIPEKICGVANP